MYKTLFQDGLESGTFDMTKWFYVSSSPYATIVTNPVHSGNYSAELTDNGNAGMSSQAVVNLNAYYGEVWFEAYIYFGSINYAQYYVMSLGVVWRWDVYHGLFDYYVRLGTTTSSGKKYWTVNDVMSSSQVTTGQWYHVKIMYSNTDGYRRVWINNNLISEVYVGSFPQFIHDGIASTTGAVIQQYSTNFPATDTMYFDDVSVYVPIPNFFSMNPSILRGIGKEL
jgi:hypothetical protein